jgi:hypothetical protein
MRSIAVWLALALLPAASPLAAQRLKPSPFPRLESGPVSLPQAARLTPVGGRSSGSSAGRMVVGGLLLGAGGLFAGALIGDRFQRFPCEDCIEGAFYGALVGESLAIPLGVHLADRRRGNAGVALAASLGVATLGVGAAAITDNWAVVLAIPVVQLVSSVVIERHTARFDH